MLINCHALSYSLSLLCTSYAQEILPSLLSLCLIHMQEFFLNLIVVEAASICSRCLLTTWNFSFHHGSYHTVWYVPLISVLVSCCVRNLFCAHHYIPETGKVAQFLPHIMASTVLIKMNKITIITKGELKDLKEKTDIDQQR